MQNLPETSLKHKHFKIFETKPLFDIELSAFCNINCDICPRDKLSRRQGNMAPELFDILIEWLPSECHCMFCGLGEPLLNPHVVDFVKKIDKKGARTAITTNGMGLTPVMTDSLIDAGIDMIQVSVNGISQESYDSLCSGFDYSVFEENLSYLSKQNSENIHIQLACVKQKDNLPILSEIEQFAHENDFSFFLRQTHSRGGFYYKPDEEIGFKGCGLFVKSTFITWEGDILACCHDLTGKTKLGNIRQISYPNLLKKKRKFIEKYNWFDICTYCDDIFSRYLLLSDPSYID